MFSLKVIIRGLIRDATAVFQSNRKKVKPYLYFSYLSIFQQQELFMKLLCRFRASCEIIS